MDTYIFEKNGRKRKAEKSVCKFCKKDFWKRVNGKRVFCSHNCSYGQKTLDNTKLLECHNCKKEFRIANSKLKNSKHGFYFCSRRCKDYSQSLKGNCPEIRPEHYGMSEGREIYKNLIKNSQNPICVGCGISEKYLLSVHHIDGDRKNNALNNLEIVCRNCHALRHLKLDDNNWTFNSSSLTPRDKIQEIRSMRREVNNK